MQRTIPTHQPAPPTLPGASLLSEQDSLSAHMAGHAVGAVSATPTPITVQGSILLWHKAGDLCVSWQLVSPVSPPKGGGGGGGPTVAPVVSAETQKALAVMQCFAAKSGRAHKAMMLHHIMC